MAGPGNGKPVGRPPQPRALKLMSGETRPSRLNGVEPVPAEIVPEPDPEWSAGARKLWDRLAPDMIAKKVLTAWDVPAFGELLESMVLAKFYRAQMRRELGGAAPGPGQRSAIYQYAQCSVIMQTGWTRFGMTPSDRSRLIASDSFEKVNKPGTGGADLLSG